MNANESTKINRRAKKLFGGKSTVRLIAEIGSSEINKSNIKAPCVERFRLWAVVAVQTSVKFPQLAPAWVI
jgi:hypothetical protein